MENNQKKTKKKKLDNEHSNICLKKSSWKYQIAFGENWKEAT